MVFNMLKEAALRQTIATHLPDFVLPEIEAIRTEVSREVNQQRPTLFCPPIGHAQESGDCQNSWQPQAMPTALLQASQDMAEKDTPNLEGAGLFGVDFFVTRGNVTFSEFSHRPHDTDMVTLLSLNLSDFDLNACAKFGLPIPLIEPSEAASAVVLATQEGVHPRYVGVDQALSVPGKDMRIFGRPSIYPYRRMAVTLARTAAAKFQIFSAFPSPPGNP